MIFYFKKLIILMVFSCMIFASEESFINKKEYGKQLYKDPRGIGCNKCHGDNGKGKLIAKYKSKKGDQVELMSPDITNIDYKTFSKSLMKENLIMPKYYLTDSEIEAIYDYIIIKKANDEQ